MGYVLRMPQLGMSMEEGTVVEWCVAEGASVGEADPVAVVESEKTTAEVEAREDGTLGRILVAEGGTVAPGDPIGVLVGPGEDVDQYLADVEVPDVSDEDGDADTPETAAAETSAGGDGGGGADGGDEDVRATPGARRRAEEADVDLTAVEGTGPQGVVTEEDVESHEPADEPGVATRTVAESRPLSSMQRTVSERLGESDRNAVHVTLRRSFDAGPLTGTVAAAGEAGVEVSVEDLLVAAAREALVASPEFNATFEDGEHRLVEEVNVGVAVDVEDGLVTPVLDDVRGASAEDIAGRRRALVDRVRAGEFTADDLAGGTFTVTNLGPLGVDHFDPIIDPPQVAILGVGRVREDGSTTLSLSFDHRVVNGADAARFLDTLVETATDETVLAGFFDADLSPAAGRETETREVRVEAPGGLSGSYAVEGLDTPVAFDEPTEAGGGGTAPTPVEHLLGALGSCLSLAVRSMADRDGVAVDAIETDVDGTPSSGPLEAVEVAIRLESDAPDDDLDRVVTKAERACYVERALADDLEVSVTWMRSE